MASSSSGVQRPRLDRCRGTRRPETASRPAAESSRSRRRVGSQRRASWPVNASNWVPAVTVVDRCRHVVGDHGEQVGGVVDQGEPEGVGQSLGVQPAQHGVGAAGGVGADEHLATRADARSRAGELAQRVAQHRQVVGGGVGAGVARSQRDRQRLAGAVGAVVDKRAQRVEAEATLERRPGVLLVRVHRQDAAENRVRLPDGAGALAARPRSCLTRRPLPPCPTPPTAPSRGSPTGERRATQRRDDVFAAPQRQADAGRATYRPATVLL